MGRKLLILFLLANAFLFSCKKRDKTPPNLEVYFPTTDSLTDAGQEILVSGLAADNEQLSSLVIQLKDSGGTILQSETYPLQGKEMPFSFWFTAGNLYTRNGEHSLEIVALDEEGNSEKESRTLEIREIPIQYYKTFFAYQEITDGIFRIGIVDSNLNLNTPVILNAGFEMSGLVCDNRNQVLCYNNAVNGQLVGLDAWSYNQVFLRDEYAGSQIRVFSGLASNGFRWAASRVIPPYLKLYYSGGNPLSSFYDLDYPPQTLCFGDQWLLAGIEGPNGEDSRIEAIDMGTKITQTIYSGLARQGGLHNTGTGKILCWGKDQNNQGKIVMLNGSDLTEISQISFSDTLQAVCGSGEEAVFVKGDNIYIWNGSTGMLIPVLTGFRIPSSHSIAFDPVHRRVIIGHSANVKVYSEQGQTLATLSLPGCSSGSRITHLTNHLNK